MFYTIYKITNLLNGKIYIGKHQTKDLSDNYMGSGKHLKSAQVKHGIENFKKEILFKFNTEDEMNTKEAELVTEEFCLREDTYNLCPGGQGGWGYLNTSGKSDRTGSKLSAESKAKIAKKKVGNKNNLGKKFSEEHKAKMRKSVSESLKGIPKSEEHKKKIAEAIRKRNAERRNAGIV